MGPLDAADRSMDSGGDRGARSFASVAQPPAPSAKTGCPGEFGDERVALGGQSDGPFDVLMYVGVGQLAIQRIEPGPVGGPGLVVEDRVGAKSGDRGCVPGGY